MEQEYIIFSYDTSYYGEKRPVGFYGPFKTFDDASLFAITHTLDQTTNEIYPLINPEDVTNGKA